METIREFQVLNPIDPNLKCGKIRIPEKLEAELTHLETQQIPIHQFCTRKMLMPSTATNQTKSIVELVTCAFGVLWSSDNDTSLVEIKNRTSNQMDTPP